MRVLITGGGGNLGRVLAPTLEEAGHEPILMDNRVLETPHKAVRGDVRDRASLLEVFRPLRDGLALHLACLLAHLRVFLSSS
jgi:UDP-glucose 4-epimerase